MIDLWSPMNNFVIANNQVITIAILLCFTSCVIALLLSVRFYKAFMGAMPNFFVHFAAIAAGYCDEHKKGKTLIITALTVLVATLLIIHLILGF